MMEMMQINNLLPVMLKFFITRVQNLKVIILDFKAHFRPAYSVTGDVWINLCESVVIWRRNCYHVEYILRETTGIYEDRIYLYLFPVLNQFQITNKSKTSVH